MNVAGPAVHDAGDDVGERAGGRDRPFAARRHDGAGDGAGAALLAEQKDDVGEIALGALRDHVGGGRTGRAHAHVERPVEAEREAALGRVELHGRHAEIEHDAVDRFDPEIAGDAVERGEFAFDQGQAPGRGFDLGLRRRNRRGVAIDADDLRVRRREDRRRIAAGAEGAVDVDAAVMGSEVGDDLAQQHGDMARRRAGRRRLPGIAVGHGRRSRRIGARAAAGASIGAPAPGAVRSRREAGAALQRHCDFMANPMQPKENWIGWR